MATHSAIGFDFHNAAAMATANNGANHMLRNSAPLPLPRLRSTSLDGFHCSR